MTISRRQLLGAGAIGGAGLLLPLRVTSAAQPLTAVGLTPFTEQLPTLAQLGVIDATAGAPATITMVNATHRFHKALSPTPTFCYRSVGGAQDYLGPVVVARKGVPFDLTVVNHLGNHPLARVIDTGIMGATERDKTAPRAAVHLHGGNTASASDGDPLDSFGHGQSRVYHYGNTQDAAGIWYHDHALGITRLNVFAGLAGGYLVRDVNDPGDGSTGLPPAPTYEVPLVLQDRMFARDGTLDYPVAESPVTPGGGPWIPEFFGDVATVNGKAWPNLYVDRGKYRFRVYNGSQARFYNVTLKTSSGPVLPFFQIGSDGGLLDAPVPLSSMLIAPGERADLVVDFAALPPGTTVVLTNNAGAPFPGLGPVEPEQSPVGRVMRFTVTSKVGWRAPLPPNLRSRTAPVTRLAGSPVARTRQIVLVEVHNGSDEPTMVLLNNRSFLDRDGRPPSPVLTARSNTLEEWEFINTTVDAHPMHLHYTQFQVLNRQSFNAAAYLTRAYGVRPAKAPIWPVPNTGPQPSLPATPFLIGGARTPSPREQGWKDTVVAMPGQVTRILVPFGANPAGVLGPMAIGANHTGDYVAHCHILEHEENDMMLRYRIV